MAVLPNTYTVFLTGGEYAGNISTIRKSMHGGFVMPKGVFGK